MPVAINNPSCIFTGANTGIGNCRISPKHIKGFILLPKSKILTEAECQTMETTLKALFVLASPSARAYPFMGFDNFNDASKDAAFESKGYGNEVPLDNGKYIWEFQHSFGIEVQKSLSAFNYAKNYSVIFIDNDGVYWGTKKLSSGVIGFAGIDLDYFYASPLKLATGAASTIYTVRFALTDTKDINADVAYVKSTYSNVSELKGIQNLFIKQVSVAANKVTVQIYTIDGINVYDTLGTALQATVALWLITKSNATVTTTSVTLVPSSKSFDIVATGTGVHELKLAAPAVLATASVGGDPGDYYESDTLTFTLP